MSPVIKINENAQATLEIAIFGSLLLIVLLTLLNYTRSIREQQKLEIEVFEQAANDSWNYNFTAREENGDYYNDSGATVSISKSIDRQSNLLFEPSRRSYSAGYSVLWSGASDPPDVTEYKVNEDTIDTKKKKIYLLRDPEATDTPDGELQLGAKEVIALLCPLIAQALDWAMPAFFDWWSQGWTVTTGGMAIPYGGSVVFALRGTAFYLLTDSMLEAMDHMKEVEERAARLEDQDKQYQEWGWRISNHAKDEWPDGITAGMYYVKEIEAQVYDQEVVSKTDTNYSETKEENTAAISGRRKVDLKDQVTRIFRRRYDETVDSTLPLDQHVYNYTDKDGNSLDVTIEQGLDANGTYSTGALGTVVSRDQTWTTPN